FGIPRAPMSFRGVSGAIMDIIQKSSIGLPVHIPKGGEGVYEFVYIKDVIKALVLACYTSNLKHRVFNIGSGEVMSLWDFVNIVKEFIPNAKIEIGTGELLPSARGPLDCTRAYEELGFKNSYTIRSAIKEIIEELRNYSNPSAL
ncbi:MAG: NAD(P)-dependent oxidoreductase, partial [Nitrososphaerota archaeon]|nr:NAD(P)-dependent oxidoreductase [Nitrososphaerota archaeon]